MPHTDPRLRERSLLPALTLVALVLALLGGWWLFPKLQAYMTEQDCIASGRTNCVRPSVESRP